MSLFFLKLCHKESILFKYTIVVVINNYVCLNDFFLGSLAFMYKIIIMNLKITITITPQTKKEYYYHFIFKTLLFISRFIYVSNQGMYLCMNNTSQQKYLIFKFEKKTKTFLYSFIIWHSSCNI